VVLRFDLEAGISIDVSVHDRGIKAINTTVQGWQKLLGGSGPDFLRDLVGITIPIFVGLVDALQLVAYPITEMLSQAADDLVKLLAEARLSASLSLLPNETFIELGWNENRGIYTEMGFNLRASLGLQGIPLVNEIFIGLKLCAGVTVAIGSSQEPLTSLTLCPEVLVGKTAVDGMTSNMVIPDLSPTAFVPDKKLCVRFKSFETDLDLDDWKQGLWHEDEPFAEVCFQGKCQATSKNKRFSGDTVTWNEERCMDVTQSHLFGSEAGSLAFVVKEQDIGSFHEQYTQQQLWKLPEDCTEKCAMTFEKMPIPPKHKGSKAKLVVEIEFKEIGRRLMNKMSKDCGSRQSAVVTTLALSGNYGGVTYPDLFSSGKGEEVVPKADAPEMRPQDADISCVDVENLPVDDLMSSAPGMEFNFYLMFVSSMTALVVSGL